MRRNQISSFAQNGTSPFKSARWRGVSSVDCWQPEVCGTSGSNAGYTVFRGSVKSTGYPLHSTASPPLPHPASPCAITFQLESTYELHHLNVVRRLRLKYDSTCAETRFRLSRKTGRVHLNRPGGRGVSSVDCWQPEVCGISGSNAGYTVFRGSVKSTVYPLHSPVSPFSSPASALPCAITFQLDSTTSRILPHRNKTSVI